MDWRADVKLAWRAIVGSVTMAILLGFLLVVSATSIIGWLTQ